MSKDVSSFYLYYASKLLNKYLGEQENAILEMHEITHSLHLGARWETQSL